MTRLAIIVVVLVVGCGGKPAPQPQQPPISNTTPVAKQDPAPRRTSDCGCSDCSIPAMIEAMCHYTDQVCTCKDMDCLTKATSEWAKTASNLFREMGDNRPNVNEADKRFSEGITKKITVCVKTITDEIAKNAGAGSGGTP